MLSRPLSVYLVTVEANADLVMACRQSADNPVVWMRRSSGPSSRWNDHRFRRPTE